MRLLTEEERIKIDSSEETLKKWKDFLPTAVKNLGYREETYTNLFPYDKATFYAIDPEKDVPKINEQSGRLIFKRSMADKLEMWLGIGRINNTRVSNVSKEKQLYLLNFIGDIFKTMANRNSKDYVENVRITAIKEAARVNTETQNLPVEEYKVMTIQSELVFKDNFFTEEEEKWFDKNIGISDICAMVEAWKNIDTSHRSDKAPIDLLKAMAQDNEEPASLPYIQTCFENYLVVSMNPSDKLLCSTKQAFTSCMSIMDNNRPVGKQQGPCYGIPALMDNEGVWTLFLTAGCHKNFYFDSDQWMKPGEERDKSQAFKYMKMTARAFAYDGMPITTLAWKTDGVDKLAERLFPRMYIGRLFSQMDSYSRQIGSVFETLVSKELAKFNIKTSINEGHRILEEFGYTYAINAFPKYLESNSKVGYVTWPMFTSDGLAPMNDKSILPTMFKETNRKNSVYHKGKYPEMKIDYTKLKDDLLGIDNKFRTIETLKLNPVTIGYLVNPNVRADDIFGQTNSIYFDNIVQASCSNISQNTSLTVLNAHIMTDYPIIHTNIASYGCGQVSTTCHTANADFMKLMLGKQKITELCNNSKICDRCGKIYTRDQIYKLQIPNSNVGTGSQNDTLVIDICKDCLQELQDKGLVKYCEKCNVYYMIELEDKHEIVDLTTELKQKIAEAYPQYVPDEQEISIKDQIITYYTGSKTLRFDLTNMCKSTINNLRDMYGVTIVANFCVACKELQPSIKNATQNYVPTQEWKYVCLKKDTLNTKLGTIELNISVHKYDKACARKVKICSKCHRIIIQSDWNEPLVLMPNGRVICKDCLDKIRLKNKDRELLLDAIKEYLGGNNEYVLDEPMTPDETQLIDSHFKDFAKQIKSFAKHTDLSTLLEDCADDEKKALNIVRAALRIAQKKLAKEEEAKESKDGIRIELPEY